jgi:hypothetical protein
LEESEVITYAVTPEEQKDIDDFKNILKFLEQGWSLGVAISKARLSYPRYRELRDQYPSIKEAVSKFYQHKDKCKWLD